MQYTRSTQSTENVALYDLAPTGAIRQWMARGPLVSPLKALAEVVPPDAPAHGPDGRWIINYWAFEPASAALKQRVYRHLPPLNWQPDPELPISLTWPGAESHGAWRYAVAGEDDVIDFSLFNFAPQLMQGWLHGLIHAEQAVRVRAELLTIGPARLWLNGALRTEFTAHFSYVALQHIPLELDLQAGLNTLYLQADMLGWREARLAIGLRLLDLPAEANIQAAIHTGDLAPDAWRAAEARLDALHLRQFAFPDGTGKLYLSEQADGPITVEATVSLPVPETPWATVSRLNLPQGKAILTLQPGNSADLPLTDAVLQAMARLPGENTLSLTIRPAGRYAGMPLHLHREIWASAERFSLEPYGDYESRRREALEHLAAMPYDVPSSMAAVQLGRQTHISSDAIATACGFMNNRYDCADFYSVGLLALLYRYGDSPALKDSDRTRIEQTFTDFKFWIDEPGIDAMCYFTENHQVLFHTTQYLTGQRWPDRVFRNSGQTGREHMRLAYTRIENWILRRLKGNFSEWDSNAYMALDVFAMLALAEFAENTRLRELATTLLNKIFFLIACQSFRGTHGSTHGRCYVTGLKSARVDNTSSMQRIAWGMGILNGETRATGLLATAQRYRVPDILSRIGADLPEVLITQARSTASFDPLYDFRDDAWDVRTVTRRTPDGMLSAAVDHHPGTFGIQEHLWQATLGPEAVVFTTYPGNSQEHGHARPNFWAGSARLPRVGMHERTVLCLYRLEPGVGLGFTHAYFPTAHFDEWQIEGGWAFARAGNGYVALWAAGDLRLTADGRHAGQELRTSGDGLAWLCHIGRAAEDGDFANFCRRVKAHAPEAAGNRITWTTPDGEQLHFAWEGPLTVNGRAVRWDDMPHYANAYTDTPHGAEAMTIRFGDQAMTLDLARGVVR